MRLIKYQFIILQKTDKRESNDKIIPNANLNVTNDTVICQQHWPSNFDTIEVHRKICPKNPPSVWPGVPSSQIQTPSAVQRNIKKISVLLEIKLLMNLMHYTNLKESLNKKKRLCMSNCSIFG